MDDKICIECYECGYECLVNRSYWESEMADDFEARTCPFCHEVGGMIV